MQLSRRWERRTEITHMEAVRENKEAFGRSNRIVSCRQSDAAHQRRGAENDQLQPHGRRCHTEHKLCCQCEAL